MQDRPPISDSEWRVMHEVWMLESQNLDATSRTISDLLSRKIDWSDGTIKTLLHRLVQKGVLRFQRKGNRHLYRSNFSEQECVDQVCTQLLHAVFHGRPLPMIKYLVSSARLSGREVESLHEVLDQIRQTLPPQTPRDKILPAA